MTQFIRCGRPATYVAALMSLGAVGASCTADVPTTPSFQQDIMPILAANCVRCHSYPTLGGAPKDFRLDVFGDTMVRLDGPDAAPTIVLGASSLAGLSASRSASEARPMPPRFMIEEHQIATLQAWAQLPESGEARRGEARPGNHAPTATVAQIPVTGPVLQLRVTVADEDRDLVVGELWINDGTAERFVGSVRSGTQTVEWLSTGSPVGTYAVTAKIDDGAMVHTVEAGQLTIGGI